MKKLIFLSAFFLLGLAACNPDDDSNANPVTGNPPQGKWTVTYFWDKVKDETGKFSGYTFEFQSGGIFSAVKGTQTWTGTWSHNSSSTKLIINITGNDALDELTDDWLILENTDNIIKLKDDNEEHLEELHFSKL